MSQELYQEIGEQFAQEYGTTLGQMFGKPCLKNSNNKAFAAFFKDEMVFKLGKEEVDLLKQKYEGAVNWDPSGKDRAMKDWLQVPTDYIDDWSGLAKQALQYVLNTK